MEEEIGGLSCQCCEGMCVGWFGVGSLTTLHKMLLNYCA